MMASPAVIQRKPGRPPTKPHGLLIPCSDQSHAPAYELPPELEAGEPPEARGLERDEVRLMVSYLSGSKVFHTRFRELPSYLKAGDVLVINTSGTQNAALNAERQDGTILELHLSTHLPADLWVVELRRPEGRGTLPFYKGTPGETINLPGGAQVQLLTPYRTDQRAADGGVGNVRLWIAALQLSTPVGDYLDRYGFPIRYKYVHESWPSTYYQTVYATEKGSAEMPSAGRAFTPALITSLIALGIQFAPMILHTGVASLENGEPPYEEYYRIPTTTADLVNRARARGDRIIAVGTTAVRGLETATDERGTVQAGEGWTRLFITPDRPIRSINGLLTGFHEPHSTHLAMLASLAGYDHLCRVYQQALQEGYLWHEFGDLHLILPAPAEKGLSLRDSFTRERRAAVAVPQAERLQHPPAAYQQPGGLRQNAE